MSAVHSIERKLMSDAELLEAIRRDLHAIYSDVIRQPLPPALAALQRIETRSNLALPLTPAGMQGPARS